MKLLKRITALEARRAHAVAWPELIVLCDGESLSPVQQNDIDRADVQRQPTLVICISQHHL